MLTHHGARWLGEKFSVRFRDWIFLRRGDCNRSALSDNRGLVRTSVHHGVLTVLDCVDSFLACALIRGPFSWVLLLVGAHPLDMAQTQLRPLTPPSSSAFFIHSSYYPSTLFPFCPFCCRGSIKRASTTIRDTRTIEPFEWFIIGNGWLWIRA